MQKDFSITWGLFSDTAICPTKSDENAGYDIYEDVLYSQGITNYLLKAGETKRFDTNIGYVIPTGYMAVAKERSNTGKLSYLIGAGLLDSGYRGGCGIFITNCSNENILVEFEKDSEPKAIAQIVFLKHEQDNDAKSVRMSQEEFANKYPSERGLGKEGSTGK